MSYYPWKSRFPLDIFFPIIESIENRNDLLSLALTCQTIYKIIIPHYLSYFRISSTIMDTELWEHLLQTLPACRNTRELGLTDGRIQRPHCVPSFQRRHWVGSLLVDPVMTPNLREVLHHMPNLRRVSLSWTTDLDPFRDAVNALIDSKCRLEELDLFIASKWRGAGVSNDPISLGQTMKLQKLSVWSDFNVTTLRRISIRLEGDYKRRCLQLGELTYISTMLSKAQRLTHLNLSIDHTASFVDLIEHTWPNLENLVIGSDIDLLPQDASRRNPVNLINFFKRHPKLSILSLPSNVYLPRTLPCITVKNLPALVSFSYNAPVQVPLSKVLSIASARRLRHLTISEKDSSLTFSDTDIYKELTSLQTCCITSETSFPTNYENINRILENFVAHVTNLHKIHLPVLPTQLCEGPLLETLSLLQCLPRLTHLSGLSPNGTQLSQELYQFYQLKYVITPLFSVGYRKPFSVFGLTRDKKKRCMLFEAVSENNAEYDVSTWGNFYRGIMN